MTSVSFWCLHCWLWIYVKPFYSVSVLDLEQVNVFWVQISTRAFPHSLSKRGYIIPTKSHFLVSFCIETMTLCISIFFKTWENKEREKKFVIHLFHAASKRIVTIFSTLESKPKINIFCSLFYYMQTKYGNLLEIAPKSPVLFWV